MTSGLSPFLSTRSRRVVFSILGFAGVAIYLFPIYWMLISGFKSSAEIFANPPTFFPRAPNLEAFHSVFVQENIARYLGIAQDEIGTLSRNADNPEIVSSICAVLAETDVINVHLGPSRTACGRQQAVAAWIRGE